MLRAFGAFACAATLLAALSSPAHSAPARGQLAAVVDDRLVAVNPDSSGLRTLWVPPAGDPPISGLAWSPDGNRLAFSQMRRILVFELATGRVTALTNPLDERDSTPGWSPDGTRIGFLRSGVLLARAMVVSAAGGEPQPAGLTLLDGVVELAWAPDLKSAALVVASRLQVPGLPAVVGAPAWSPDGARIAFANADGLHTIPAAGGTATGVTPAPAGSPRWSPDSGALVYPAVTQLRTIEAGGGQPQVVLGAARVMAADWQPCTAGVTVSCESLSPPHCTAATATATTQADQAIDLPGALCSDPAGRPLSVVVVKGPEHGTLAGWRYTPAPGFSGQDGIIYRLSNGVSESENVRLTIFVVPRPAPAPASPKPAATVRRAPFLTARTTPRLDRRRRTLVKLSCDQDCSLTVRLTARLRSKRTLTGPWVRRKALARRELSVRLRLPSKPASRPKTVWITGRVRNASGDDRAVRLPVRLPR